MGREKKYKPKKLRTPHLHALIARFDADSLWALLVAAGASPALRSRWASVGALAHEVLSSPPSGHQTAMARDIDALLAAVRRTLPQLSMLEDFVAADPRLDVRARVGNRALRLFPGNIERPVADVDRAHLVAEAIDDELVATVGFGVSHLVEVLVGYVDIAVSQFSPIWPLGDDDDETVSPAELLAAAELIAGVTPATLTPTVAHERALAWVTTDAAGLRYSADHPQSCFGRFARVRDDFGIIRWLPLAFLPEVLSYAVGRLARRVADQPSAQMKFAQLSAEAIRRYLWRFTDTIIGSPDSSNRPAVSPGNVVQWAVPAGVRHGLVIQLLSGLEADLIRHDDEPAAMAAAQDSRDGAETRVPFPYGSMRFAPGVELTPLIVVSTADHTMSMQRPGLLSISLDDLRWMASTSSASNDLFNFCHDMTRPGLSQIFGFEAIDYWEWWRANSKSVFSGGRAPTVMTFSPHGGEAEWTSTHQHAAAEVALARLRLPGSRDLAGIDNVDAPVVTAYLWQPTGSTSNRSGEHERPSLECWSIWTGSVPFAVNVNDDSWSSADERRLVFDMAGSLGFGVDGIATAWTEAWESAGVSGIRIKLTVQPDAYATRSIWLSESPRISSGIIEAGFSVNADTFVELSDDNPDAIRSEFSQVVGELLAAAGVESELVSHVVRAWITAPPTMTLNLVDAIAENNFLPPPVELDDAYHSEVERILAEKVRERGVVPGSYVGSEAKSLDHVIASLAKELLEEQLMEFAEADIATFAMTQLDRTTERRSRELRDLRNTAEAITTSWDPIERAAEVQSTALRLRRCNEMIAETALLSGPTGASHIDEHAWSRILAVANAYFEATMRSEAIHYQVSPRSLTVSESYEFSLTRMSPGSGNGDRPTFDLDERSLAKAAASEEVVNSQQGEVPTDLEREVSAAFADAFGFSPMDLYATLLAAARKPAAGRHDSTVTMSRDELVAHVLAETILGGEATGRNRVEAAVDLLTTTAEGLRSEPWRPWLARARKRRLLAQPFLFVDNHFVVAPHYTLASLAMYRRYIDQGQLPWSQPPAAPELDRALQRFRDAKNRQLEVATAATLRDAGYNVIENVKETKNQRLNVPTLSGEIDVIACMNGGSTIWLLEAKDPVTVHSTPQLRGQLEDFYTDHTKKPAYATQLRRKLADLEPFANEIAAALGVAPHPAMKVRAAFVTRHPIPAAFASGPFPFYTLTELTALDA